MTGFDTQIKQIHRGIKMERVFGDVSRERFWCDVHDRCPMQRRLPLDDEFSSQFRLVDGCIDVIDQVVD
ncbi:hypothetical protein Pla52n_68640 [Stieleria varia]|uniref:Uncharacterized protein n=1 Tax=Stieleria varia TaxID=2528005 RepID=A0A5C5ZPS6_9BACT|nr:hypothetical protein Pla52n_68640 [Stieleria varia]